MRSHDELQELLGAYALDAVEPDEASEVEDHLASCPRCRAEVAEHREVAALIVFGGAEAPEALWDRIAGSLSPAPPRPNLVSLDSRRARRWPAAALAAAAVLIAVLGFEVRDQAQRLERVEVAFGDPMLAAFDEALAEPGTELVTLASADESVVARVAIAEDGTGYLHAASLRKLGKDRTYQLWGVAGNRLVSLGVLGRDPGVVRFGDEGYEAFAVTEEDAPGAVVSQNKPVVSGTRTA